MSIPHPESEAWRSDAYVDPAGDVKVRAGIDATQNAVGVVGFVRGMCMLWHGLAADCPQGWEILAAAGGRYVRIISVDGDVGATGGSDTHAHTSPSHSHSHSHGYDIDHDHPNPSVSVDTGAPDTLRSVTDDGNNQADVGGATHGHQDTASVAIVNYADNKTTDSNATGTAATVNASAAADLPSWYGLWLIKYTGAPRP